MSKATQSTPADGTHGSDTESTTESTPETVSTDEVFELLSNQRRRFALHYLKHEEERVGLGELSEHVASWETDTPLQQIDSAARKRVYTSLQSHHLPKMDERGIVEYDERAGEIELNESAADLDVYLEVVGSRDVPWSQYYLGLAAVDAGLVTAAAINAWPFGALPDVAWAAFVVTTVFVSAAIHVYHDSTQRLGTDEKPPEIRD